MDNKSIEKYIPKIVLTFDDGRKDNYRVATEILQPRNLTAAFSITTGYVDGSIQKANRPGDNAALTQDKVKALYATGQFEIVGHGHEHLNTLEDWEKGLEMLEQWLGKSWRVHGVGIASPHSVMSSKQIREWEVTLTYLNVKYVRIALKNQFNYLQRIISKIARMTHSTFLYTLPIKSSLQHVGKEKVVYSVPVLHPDTVKQVIALINMAEREQRDCVLMLHSILKDGEANYNSMWTWDYNKFVKLCDFLVKERNANRIDIVTLRELFD